MPNVDSLTAGQSPVSLLVDVAITPVLGPGDLLFLHKVEKLSTYEREIIPGF